MAPMKNRVFSAIVCALIASASAFANRGVTPEDYFAFHFVSDAHLSPDGKQVAYVMTVIDQQRNRRASSIWVVATDGRTPPRRVTAENFNSTQPRWSPVRRRAGADLSARDEWRRGAGAQPSEERRDFLPVVA